MIVATYGDSVTAQGEWQTPLLAISGLSEVRFGAGGRQVGGATGMCQLDQIAPLPTDAEYLIAMGGVNDWAQSRPLGPSDGTDTDLYIGALRVMVDRLRAHAPQSTLLLATPTYSEFTQANALARGWDNGVTNNAGLSTRDYAEAVRLVAAEKGVSLIDFDALEGANPETVDGLRKDDGNHIHPNDAAGVILGAIAWDILRRTLPAQAS